MLRWSSGRRSTASEDGAQEPKKEGLMQVTEEEEELVRTLLSSHWLKGASGIPINVDGFAYEPIQRLLAVSVIIKGRASVSNAAAGCADTCHLHLLLPA